MDVYLLSVLVFLALVAIAVFLDRKNIEIKGPVLMRRTKRFFSVIETLSAPKRAWKILLTFGIFLSVLLMIYGLFVLSTTAVKIMKGEIGGPVAFVIVPAPSPDVSVGPGYMLIPFWFWIVLVAVILVPHELFHGIASRVEGVKLKSVGVLLLLFFLPGAFVEPSERSIKRKPVLSKLRIYAAGTFANILVAFAVFLFVSTFVWPSAVSPGLVVSAVDNSSEAYMAGLREGMIITEINNRTASAEYSEFSTHLLSKELRGYKPNQTLTVKTLNGTFSFVPETNSTKIYLGFAVSPNFRNESLFPFIKLLTMIWVFSIAVGMINILPIKFLDGGYIASEILEKLFGTHGKRISNTLSALTLFLLVFLFIGPFFS
ncbi:MAG: hypothetical protein GXO63_03375 [Candidatus Micrarchaeota archaeon]|nr:hypothetical protein [Candidatus Micrarchaeota archaeon]